MLTLRGSSALSPFRLEKLRADLAAAGLPVRAIRAQFVHVVELAAGSAALSTDQQGVLEKLLTYGPRRELPAVTGLVQVVAPRPGTISPWSSKATDIAHICGLAPVTRIERVVECSLDIDNAALTKPPVQLSATVILRPAERLASITARALATSSSGRRNSPMSAFHPHRGRGLRRDPFAAPGETEALARRRLDADR